MKQTKNKYIKDTLNSMRHAFRGVRYGYMSERNFRTEVAIVIAVYIAAVLLEFNYIEFAIITIAAFAVLGAELLNTAIEESWNKLHPDHHDHVGRIKDIASAGVLCFGLGAAFAGALVFVHHLFL
jgi:diacylglycerol kinase (ATP)